MAERRRLPSFAETPEYDQVRGDRMPEEEDEGDADDMEDECNVSVPPFGLFDWFLLAFALLMLGLFVLIARQVAVAIGIALLCTGVCAFSYVNAQISEGLARWLSLIVCVLSIAAFMFWSFKYVFYLPAPKSTSGCGGVFFENLDNDMSKPQPHDEL
ncbi:hypothetical protein T492DRAFT_956502 [Pavlovales sp. CCMP2436]|nr:hypothetical protein T492DRAFT_956502 [Pavlovales sp. CCMP2436]|mmetsp:Transcript_34001/g.78395  ORF Transcript_34001/g.78395 Transcript_34001/m.78395 type:complete len:157 (+) Transcript_34001:30-500(+)